MFLTNFLLLSFSFRFKQFDDAMKLFERMNELGIKKDSVTYINGVRSAGFCRPWTRSLELLEEAYSELEDKNDILPILDTVITNLKYIEKNTISSESVVAKYFDVLRWMEKKKMKPTSRTMVSC